MIKTRFKTERHKDDIADGIGACEATNTRQDRRHYLLWAELFITHQQNNNNKSPRQSNKQLISLASRTARLGIEDAAELSARGRIGQVI
jgi:hypothetical protein